MTEDPLWSRKQEFAKHVELKEKVNIWNRVRKDNQRWKNTGMQRQLRGRTSMVTHLSAAHENWNMTAVGGNVQEFLPWHSLLASSTDHRTAVGGNVPAQQTVQTLHKVPVISPLNAGRLHRKRWSTPAWGPWLQGNKPSSGIQGNSSLNQ